MPRLAILGNAARDRIGGGEPRPGGCPPFAVGALRALGREGRVVTHLAPADAALFEPALAAPGVEVVVLPARETAAFAIAPDGEARSLVVEAVGEPWSPADAARAGDAAWAHAAPLLRGDFPPETLAALARGGRRVSLDAQGLVRVRRRGPLRLDGGFDAGLLAHVTALKVAEDEAAVLAPAGLGEEEAARLGVPELLLTLGSRGCVVFTPEGAVEVGARPVAGIDTTGAGDLFMAGYAAARCEGAAPAAAAARASALVARLLRERRAA